MNKSYKDRVWLILLWVMFAGILASLYFYSESRVFDHDEFEHLHTAWKMLQGQEIYVDFFQHHHPFLDYLLMPVISVFGNTTESIFAGRHLMLLMTGGILIVTYLLSIRVFKHAEVGIISLILTSTMVTFYSKSIEIRPDIPQTLAALLSIYFLFTFYDRRSYKSFWISAVFLALAFLVLQKSIALILVFSILFMYDLREKAIVWKDILIYAVVFLVCISPYYIYLFLTGAFEQYLVMNWIVNIYVKQGFAKWLNPLATVRENSITCVLYAIGIVALLKSTQHRRFAILSIGLIIAIFLMFKNLWRHYFMLAAPPFAIIASYALYTIFKSKYAKFVVIIGAIYIPMAIMHNHALFNMDNEEQSAQIDKINYVLSITDENDRVYDGNIFFNVFRDDIDYLWFCVRETWCLSAIRRAADYDYDIYEQISAQKPKVISTFRIKNLEDPRIKNHYRRSNEYENLLIRKE